jgi:flagellar protein FliO/FliZ
MSRRWLGLLWALPLAVMAAEPVAQVAAPAAGSSVTGQLTQLVLGLLLVVGLIFALAWLLRRVQRIGPQQCPGHRTGGIAGPGAA